MKKTIKQISVFLLSCSLLSGNVFATSPLDWYNGEKSENTQEVEQIPQLGTSDSHEQYGQQEEIPQSQIHMVEQKIISPTFGCAIGKTMIPEGWKMSVTDLTIGSESACCPNAVLVTATSPDGQSSMAFISRREFEQSYFNYNGIEVQSDDDYYDYSELMHYLNYRNASGVCDLMPNILYGENMTFLEDKGLSDEEQQAIQTAGQEYQKSVETSLGVVDAGNLMGTEFTAARRNYTNQSDDCTIFCASCGFHMGKDSYGCLIDRVMWAIPFVYALRTPSDVHDSYQEAFDVFCSSTAVSKEYESMREQNALKIITEMVKARNSGYSYTYSGLDSSIEDSTISSGDTYSAMDAWDDYIKDETDYTTGSGEHVKIPTYFDHVAEGDDGTIYAGNSWDDIPYGATDLTPTEIGDSYDY